jgi:pimeloyl-ACP methyl ester carboxylesterase
VTRHIALSTGATLRYAEAGSGSTVVLVHGGGGDLQYWRDVMPRIAEKHRTIAYSRRYSPPNANEPMVPDYSPIVDARDLIALLEAIDAGPAHIVGASIGACAAMFAAAERPDLVRSLVAAEPPFLRLTTATDEGRALLDTFLQDTWRPAADAFRAGRPDDAMREIISSFIGAAAFDALSARSREKLVRNSGDWHAFAISTSAFPDMPHDAMRSIAQPVLMLSAERTTRLHALADEAIEATLPNVSRMRITRATHDMWVDQPEQCLAAALDFIERVERA